MASNLTDFDEGAEGAAPVEQASDGPAEDITLDDIGEDKELNTPPDDAPESDEPEDEPEADKPEEAESEPKKEAEAEQKKEEPKEAPKADAGKTTEEIVKYLGLDSTLKIKGKEYKLSEFEKDDLLAYLQKGIRMNQIGNELSQRERALVERERVAEANALQATQLLSQHRGASSKAAPAQAEPPDELRPSEYDTEDVKSVKQAALNTWKQNQELAQRLDTIEGGLKNQQTEVETQRFYDELNAHRADFPLASVEEVIAVHALRPEIPLSDLVRRSHAIYGSAEHIEEVFKHAPEVKKAVEDRIIASYLARNSKAKVISEKPSTQGVRTTPATPNKIRSLDDAGRAARRMIEKMATESEFDHD